MAAESSYHDEGADLVDQQRETAETQRDGDEPLVNGEREPAERAGEARQRRGELAGRRCPADQCPPGDEHNGEKEKSSPVLEAAQAENNSIHADRRRCRRPDTEETAEEHEQDEPARKPRGRTSRMRATMMATAISATTATA